MKCIAIDDEWVALAVINNYCPNYPYIQLSTFTNPIEGLQAIKEQRPHIVFLDIEMKDFSGLDIAAELPEGVILILTTAHVHYALKGYEVYAIDFLVKPFSPKRFASAVERAKQILESRTNGKSQNEIITIKVEYQSVNVIVSEISHIESMDNYIKINTIKGKAILTKMSLKQILELLPSCDFLRVHRSFVVARSQILSYTKQQIMLHSGPVVPIGRNYIGILP